MNSPKIQGGVPFDLTCFYPSWYHKRLELGLRAKDTVLISVGRLDRNKNNSTLIKAVALCNKPFVHLVICGDGEEKKALLNLSKELGVKSQIHFLGNRSDMKELYAMADIFVMASYREGLSRSIMEAMATGLPIACSRIRGNIDLIDEDKGGVLFEPKNVDEIASALDKLLVSDMESMGRYNKDKIHNFSLDFVIDEMEKIYRKEI